VNRLALFDCDGTLVDGHASHCRALQGCFADSGYEPPDPARAQRMIGLGLVETMAALLPDASSETHLNLALGYKAAFQDLRRRGLVEEPLFDGMSELLDTLEDGGWLLGIATGKSDRGLTLCLERHGLAGRFVTLQTSDRHPSKPDPSMIEAALAETGADPQLSLMIGDTSYDMAMARAAGLTAVGVLWGYHGREELLAAGADYVVETPADVPGLVRAIA
jgi:phosphoglycolate phosphatase